MAVLKKMPACITNQVDAGLEATVVIVAVLSGHRSLRRTPSAGLSRVMADTFSMASTQAILPGSRVRTLATKRGVYSYPLRVI